MQVIFVLWILCAFGLVLLFHPAGDLSALSFFTYIFFYMSTLGVVVAGFMIFVAGRSKKRDLVIEMENLESVVPLHLEALVRKRRTLVSEDAYGNRDFGKWDKELNYFLDSVIRPKSATVPRQMLKDRVEHLVGEALQKGTNNFDSRMDPIEYEHFCAELLRKSGWSAVVTQAAGDQGIDVRASKGSYVVAVQCKLYSSPVGNKAVQEVHAGAGFAGCNKAIVVSNAGYTSSAKMLARSLGVSLMHHDDLPKLDIYFGRDNARA
jgi:restriction system protein